MVTQRKKLMQYLRALLLILLPLFAVWIFFTLGFRITNGLSVVYAPRITITDVPQKAVLFVDNKKTATSGTKHTIVARISPGDHSLVVGAPNYNPWVELISVTQEPQTLRAIMTLRSIDGTVLTKKDPEWKTATKLLAAPYTLPNKNLPLQLGTNTVIANETHVAVIENGKEKVIFTPVEGNISSVLPFPGRDDVVVVVSGPTVYLVEIDTKKPQTINTLLNGLQPHIVTDGKTLYGKDGDTTFRLDF